MSRPLSLLILVFLCYMPKGATLDPKISPGLLLQRLIQDKLQAPLEEQSHPSVVLD